MASKDPQTVLAAKEARTAASIVLPVPMRFHTLLQQPAFLAGNHPLNECRQVRQAFGLLSAPATKAGVSLARKQFNVDSRILHADKLPAGSDPVTRWMAATAFNTLLVAKQLTKDGKDLGSRTGCMADAEVLNLTGPSIVLRTDAWVGIDARSSSADTSMNTRHHLLAWRHLTQPEKLAISNDAFNPQTKMPSSRFTLAAATRQARLHADAENAAAAAAAAAVAGRAEIQAEDGAAAQAAHQAAAAAAHAKAAAAAAAAAAQAAADQAAQDAQDAQDAAQHAAAQTAAAAVAAAARVMLQYRRTHPSMPLTLQPTGRNDDSILDHISAEGCYLGYSVQHIERFPTKLT